MFTAVWITDHFTTDYILWDWQVVCVSRWLAAAAAQLDAALYSYSSYTHHPFGKTLSTNISRNTGITLQLLGLSMIDKTLYLGIVNDLIALWGNSFLIVNISKIKMMMNFNERRDYWNNFSVMLRKLRNLIILAFQWIKLIWDAAQRQHDWTGKQLTFWLKFKIAQR